MKIMISFFKKIVPFLLNRYIFISLIFVVWIIFFDKNNLISQHEYTKKLKVLNKNKEYYDKEIDINRKEMDELSIEDTSTITDPERLKKLEKFAREKYLMKKDDEDVFVITKE